MSPIITPGGGGGGSQPSGWQLADFLFTEQPTAGVISGGIDLPAGSWLLGLFLIGIADWFDANAHLTVADSQANVYFSDEEAFATDLQAGFFQNGTTTSLGSNFTPNPRVLWAHFPDARTVTVSYTTTVADPSPTGQTRVGLIYSFGDVQVAVP